VGSDDVPPVKGRSGAAIREYRLRCRYSGFEVRSSAVGGDGGERSGRSGSEERGRGKGKKFLSARAVPIESAFNILPPIVVLTFYFNFDYLFFKKI
jgi:hypothetical protein